MHKLFIKLRGLLLILALYSCGSAKNNEDPIIEKQNLNTLEALIVSRNFKFNAEFSFPLQTNAVTNTSSILLNNTGNAAGRILLTKGSFLKMSKGVVESSLPYTGEIRTPSYANATNSNIEINSQAENYKYDMNTKKGLITLRFKAKQSNESFDITMDIQSDGFTTVFMSSSMRTQIRYTGKLQLEESKQN